ncbi:MAG: SDR family oxidoreductase [Anaerolineae bacterium]|nr:SDR family oxidoreductase [Anaerolineae bacterium]
MEVDNPGVVLITGASSGIGEAFARKLASMGYNLALVARRKERLDAIAGELESRHSIKVEILQADLSHEEDISRIERRIADMDALTMLVNNAGFGTTGHCSDVEIAKSTAMIAVHVTAPTRLSHAALPKMVARKQGAIINVASPSAFVLFPGNTIYSATKHYLITFSEGLGLELEGTGVRVQALCPGFTRSGFHHTEAFTKSKSDSMPGFLWMSAEEVVKCSLEALKRKQVVVVPGFINRLMYIRMRRFTAYLARKMFQ